MQFDTLEALVVTCQWDHGKATLLDQQEIAALGYNMKWRTRKGADSLPLLGCLAHVKHLKIWHSSVKCGFTVIRISLPDRAS